MVIVELFGFTQGEVRYFVLVDMEYHRGVQRWSLPVGPVDQQEAREWLKQQGFVQRTADGWSRPEPMWIHFGTGLVPIHGAFIRESIPLRELEIDEPIPAAG